MPTDQLDVAVVGVGFIGELHTRLYDEHNLTNLAAVVDIDEERAREVADSFDVPHVETDVGDAIERHDLDAVTVATPEAYHREPTETALEHGVSVLLEKPIAETVGDARAIGEAVDAADAQLMIGYCCRFNPENAALKDRVDAGEIGDVYGIQAARVANREVYEMVADWTHTMYYLAVHDIDLMRWYVGADVESVYATASDGIGDVETPAVVSTTLRFENGAVGTLETNWARSDSYPTVRTDEVRLTGTEGHGRVIVENDGATVATEDGFDFLDANVLHGRETDMYRFELDHFVESVLNDETPMVTWEDGLHSLEVANAAIDSMETGEPVRVGSD
jgi:predicted dehydrogenase